MSEETTERLVVHLAPAAVYDIAADIERYPEWVADIKSVTIDERDGLGRPAVATFRAAAFGRSTTYTLRYDYHQAPEVLAWTQEESDLTSKLEGAYHFQMSDQGCEVVYHLEVELRIPIPGFVKSRAQSRIQTAALRELKVRAETSR